MASLTACPKELQHSILEMLSPHDLHSVSLVNRDLRIVAEPLLYANAEMKWSQDKVPPVVLLLRTIIDRPELAAYIRRLHLDGEGGSTGLYWNSYSLVVPTIDLQINEASALVNRTKVAHAGLWIHELHAGTMDSVLSLLISQLPNLTSLHLGASFTSVIRLLGMMLRAALCEPSEHQLPRYHNLSEVTFHRPQRKTIQNTADVLSFFYLPGIRHFSGEIDTPDKFEWPAKKPPSPPLESLELSGIREEPLERLCSFLGSVQKMEWEFCYDMELDHGGSQSGTGVMRLDKIAKAMHHLRYTLTDLTITANWHAGDHASIYQAAELPLYEVVSGYPPRTVQGSLDGLTSLHNLSRLQVPWIYLVGELPSSPHKRLRDGLPGNIETLVLTSDSDYFESFNWSDESIYEVVVEELRWRIRNMTRLRCISLLFWLPEEPERRMRLGLAAAQAGVELIWPEEFEFLDSYM
ncbi:hypothetical protein ACJ41O_005364 [Fusarium nematophilum]